LAHGSETWVLSKSDENILGVFERKILRTIFGPTNENGEWRINYNNEIYRVPQEERTIFWEVIVSVILSKKLYMNMCPIPNGFRDRAI
jgi:hypothetical protein